MPAQNRRNASGASRRRRDGEGRANVATRRSTSAMATLTASIARHPATVGRIVAGLIVAVAAVYFVKYSGLSEPHKDRVASEARKPAPPAASTPRSIAMRPEAHDADDDAPAPTKSAPRNKFALAQGDPAVDRWFIDAYLRCWTPPAPLPRGGDYAAKIRVLHGADGSLAATPVLVNPPSDPEWRAYADSAVRAVTKCSPLAVPSQYLPRFEQWKKMTLYFAPTASSE